MKINCERVKNLINVGTKKKCRNNYADFSLVINH